MFTRQSATLSNGRSIVFGVFNSAFKCTRDLLEAIRVIVFGRMLTSNEQTEERDVSLEMSLLPDESFSSPTANVPKESSMV
eukprot:CAMPEP_0197237512 /NCGR_PEP_ID=MMETSP1429-20130617/4326_1 /TAXON_ID=49237 /ORGANISM="Chaetoceros  sp., Strain UNC1202" /LENGTH=80 /DNA_ID=CAMNT_0042696527 /DNA_START=170 /DNA_END=412 /DNA_ORIENTATION=-